MHQIKPFRRKANYYETDRMDIVHHSNYIRWFEEARVHMLEEIGCPFETIEARGLVNPVLSMECEYKYPVKFADEFQVDCYLTQFNGCKYVVEYVVTNLTTGKLACKGKSSHCFTDVDLKPVRIKNSHPDIYEIFNNFLKGED